MIIQGQLRKEHSNSANPFWENLNFPIGFIEIHLDNIATAVDERIITHTDLFGNFKFEGIPNGTYQLTLDHPKYKPYSEIITPQQSNISRIIYLKKNVI